MKLLSLKLDRRPISQDMGTSKSKFQNVYANEIDSTKQSPDVYIIKCSQISITSAAFLKQRYSNARGFFVCSPVEKTLVAFYFCKSFTRLCQKRIFFITIMWNFVSSLATGSSSLSSLSFYDELSPTDVSSKLHIVFIRMHGSFYPLYIMHILEKKYIYRCR